MKKRICVPGHRVLIACGAGINRSAAFCIAALVEANPLTLDCHLYGVQGDFQKGIDVVVTQRGAAGD